jgi:transcriptional regulator with XRE-family HTH domain
MHVLKTPMTKAVDEVDEYMRLTITAWLERNPGKTASDLAKAAGLTPAHISTIRSGKRGVGRRALAGLTSAMGLRPDAVADGAAHFAKFSVYIEPFDDGNADEHPMLGAPKGLLGWGAAEAGARERYPHVPPEIWDDARNLIYGIQTDVLFASPELVYRAAELCIELRAAGQTYKRLVSHGVVAPRKDK